MSAVRRSARRPRAPARQRGMGIVEVMIGILIGMIVILAVYNVFALAEGYKRTTVGVADAQTTGLFAQFTLAREIGNAGNGLALDASNLALCRKADANWVTPPSFFALPGARAIRPMPVLIRDGGGPNQPDELIATYSSPTRVVNSVLVTDKPMAVVGDIIYVQSPNGFRVGDRIIVNMNDASAPAGFCELSIVTGVTPGDSLGNVATGMVGLSHPNLGALYKPTGSVDGPRVLNLGQPGASARTLFDIANNQLRTTDLFANAPAVPIAQNVVLLKAQYGIDCNSTGVITWTSATASGVCGLNYTPDDFVPLPPAASAWTAPLLARIRAVRIAIVVRSDEPEADYLKNPAAASPLKNQTATLFDCSTHDAACQGSIAIDNTVLADGWRHRTYETIVPMRNAIYNNGT